MVRREQFRARRTNVVLAVLAVIGGLLATVTGPSSADVTGVTGSAFGASVPNLSIFGGVQTPFPPTPTVTLPAAGSADPVTASVQTLLVKYGPANIFSSGPVTVSTEGTTGADGSVSSSVDITTINTSGQEVFTADSMSSECTADETSVSGSVTIENGTVQTSEEAGPGGTPIVVDVPASPEPNYTVDGTLEGVGDTFQYIFNEQVENDDGSLTVSAFHLRLLGPTAVGDAYVGQVTCGVTATTTTTSTTQPGGTTTTTQPGGTTTTTQPGGTTTTTRADGTTTTTRPGGTTTTTRATGTTSTTVVPPGLNCDTVTPSGSATAQANPTSVPAGGSASVTGGGFTPGDTLDLGLCSTPVSLGTATADASGNFTATVTIPAGTPAGTHTIVVTDGSRVATASITVVAIVVDGGGGGRGPLSRTGSDSRRLAGLALLAMVLGVCAVRAARYRRYVAPWDR